MGERLNDLWKPQADPPRLHYELLHLLLEKPPAVAGARLRDLGDHGANARVHFKPALVDQVLNYLVRGVWMDL